MQDLFRLDGRVVLVTGGGRGLGASLARACARAGARVAVGSRKLANCETVARALAAEHGVRAHALALDVADEASVRAAFDEVESALGPVDALVNNAGATWGAPAAEHPASAFDKVLAVNARGSFLCAREAAQRWIRAGRGGVVLNLASVAGLGGTPPEVLDAVAYSASKAAVVELTRDLAVKWARHGIRVNALAPGWFPTDMSRALLDRNGARILADVPLARFGREDELAGAALLLLSDAGSYITGQVLAIDGGLTAR